MSSDNIGKLPPQALENEEAVLSAMLLDPSCVDEVMEELKPDAFYSERNRLIFEAMYSLFMEHLPIDLVTVSTKLISQGKLESVGGMPVLADLSGKLGSSAYVETYVGVLKQKAVQRALITAANKILEDAYSEDIKFDDLVDGALNKVYNATDSLGRQSVQDIGSVINAALSRLDAAQTQSGLGGVPSGFPTLDAITNGWQASDLIILAARPAVGKTAFALNLARNAAVDHHVPVAFFSLEMSAIQLANRLMVRESGLSADKIKGSVKFQNDEWTLLEQSIVRLQKAPLYVDDTPGLPISEFRSKVKALWKQKHLGMVIVDYLQLMQGPTESKGVREQEVAAISRQLKVTAKELNIPIIALSQLSRNVVQREKGNGRPMLSDLRESGSIEQDADMVIFIHRPDANGLSENAEDKEKTEIIIAKHRNGETKSVEMSYKGERLQFVETNDSLYKNAQMVESKMNDVSADITPEEPW